MKTIKIFVIFFWGIQFSSYTQTPVTFGDAVFTGKVGVKVTNPSKELEVNGTIKANSLSLNGSSEVIGSGDIGSAVSIVNSSKTQVGQAKEWKIYNMSGSTYGNSLQFWVYGSGNLAQSKLIINDNGNVGIGKTPSVRLDVEGKIKAQELELTGNIKAASLSLNGNSEVIGSGDIGSVISIVNSSKTQVGQAKEWKIYNMSGSTYGNSLQFWVYGSGNLAQSRLIINDNGNVGIGVGNPVNKLEVNGTIRSKEIKIETGWADYVFSKDYQLLPLTELKQYIVENKHLPGMPTETEVKENGVNLGEMQAKLLQKIEELTLYAIQQQEMIDKLNAKIEEMENKKK
ncbi:MAG: hypothetical protein FWF52_08725 [Candidatus Azobacteroides sp.]|nr:hypothetical protein [Candidatus Azobacteroides sp.]